MTKRKCLFCSNGANSKEHVWPQWILQVLPARRPVRQRLGTGKEVSYSGEFKLKGVCTTCNNGWMSELETEVKPILSPIVQDLSIQLEIEDQKKLALWAFKTAIVLEGTKERSMKRYFESGLGPALRTSRDILGRTMIWIGRSSGPFRTVRIPVNSISVPEGRRSVFLHDSDQGSERSDAGEMIVSEVIGIVKNRVGFGSGLRSEATPGSWRLKA